ncbi:hypothetical protein GCM10023333_39920 [Ferrimonas pelagia]|uniref:MSHA biogenesis protein MshC n=1 Tax=Ferrimonas pelagia TaxID=1177826 RepID=A0ABP9FG17_9GAMM
MIELVVTLLLVAILALYAAPKFIGPSAFQTEVTRDALLAELRALQQFRLAGQDCRFQADAAEFGLQGDCASQAAYELDGVSLTLAGNRNFALELDERGRPVSACSGGCQLQLLGQSSLAICIGSEGYVHGC